MKQLKRCVFGMSVVVLLHYNVATSFADLANDETCSNQEQETSVEGHAMPVCTQLPVRCTSNSDCSCSGCCATFDGSGSVGICQPTCATQRSPHRTAEAITPANENPRQLPSNLILAEDKGSRVHQCLGCCGTRESDCLKNEPGAEGRCHVNYENCVANCNTEGATPSNWNCWPYR